MAVESTDGNRSSRPRKSVILEVPLNINNILASTVLSGNNEAVGAISFACRHVARVIVRSDSGGAVLDSWGLV